MLIQLVYLAAVTVPLVVTDVRSLRLPNRLVLPGLLLLLWGIVWAALSASAGVPAVVRTPDLIGAPDVVRGPDVVGVPGVVDVLDGVATAVSAWGGVTGAIAGGGLLLGGRMFGAVGMGDVKLGAWLGGLAGMARVTEHPEALGRGAAAGAVVIVAVLAVEVAAWTPTFSVRFPFGPALLLSFWVALADVRPP